MKAKTLALGLPLSAAIGAATLKRVKRDQYVPRLRNRLFRMPGRNYYNWLERFHRELAPTTYVEVGIFDGRALALARPPTRAIGVDPAGSAIVPLKTETHIFPETSDAFFANRRLENLLPGRPVDLAFIDGLHLFEQALRDFINLERCAAPHSVILMHDVVPLDEPSQTRDRATKFWTGDVWKALLCLKHYRPDLDVFTIATSPSGLAVISGLDPSSRVLTDACDDVVRNFKDLPFSEIKGRTHEALNIVANDWDIVAARLRARGILGGDRLGTTAANTGNGVLAIPAEEVRHI